SLFFSFTLISVFLLIGAILRAKVKALQKLFLPASVIGGFIGLLLGPIVLKQYAVLPIPVDWISIASLLPGLLIVPVVASVPLGLKLKGGENKAASGEKSNGSVMKPIIIMFLVLSIVGSAQNLFGVLTASTFKNVFNYDNIYATFGTEL